MIPHLVLWAAGAGAVSLGFVSYEIWGAKKGVLTAERKLIFDAAMRDLTDPVKLRKLADAFDAEGLPDQAKQLRARAAMLEAPPSVQAAQQAAKAQALATTDPSKAAAVQNLANAFATQGDPSSAAQLSQAAQALASQPDPNDPQNLPDSDPRSPYYAQWLLSQIPGSPIQAPGTAPVATPGTALGDGLGAVQTVQTEAPKGTPYTPPPVGDNTGGAMDDGSSFEGDQSKKLRGSKRR